MIYFFEFNTPPFPQYFYTGVFDRRETQHIQETFPIQEFLMLFR